MVDCFKAALSLQCANIAKPFDFGKKFEEQSSVLKTDTEFRGAYQCFETKNNLIMQRIEGVSVSLPLRKQDTLSPPDVESNCDKVEIRHKMCNRRDSFSSCSSDSAIYCSSRHTKVNTNAHETPKNSSHLSSQNDKRHRHSSDSSIMSNASDASNKEPLMPSMSDILNALKLPSACSKESFSETSKNITRVSKLNTQSTISFSPRKITNKVETIVKQKTVSYTCNTVEQSLPSSEHRHNLRRNIRRKQLCHNCDCNTPHITITRRYVEEETTTKHTSVVQKPIEKKSIPRLKRLAETGHDSNPNSPRSSKKKKRSESECDLLYEDLNKFKWGKRISKDNILTQTDFRRAASFSVYSKSTQLQRDLKTSSSCAERTTLTKSSHVSENGRANKRKMRVKLFDNDASRSEGFPSLVNSNTHSYDLTEREINSKSSSKTKGFTKTICTSSDFAAKPRSSPYFTRRKGTLEDHNGSLGQYIAPKLSSIDIDYDKPPKLLSNKINRSTFEPVICDNKKHKRRIKSFSDFICTTQTVSKDTNSQHNEGISLPKVQYHGLTGKSKLNESLESARKSILPNCSSTNILSTPPNVALDMSQNNSTNDDSNTLPSMNIDLNQNYNQSSNLKDCSDTLLTLSPSPVSIENDDILLPLPLCIDSNSGKVIATDETMVSAESCVIKSIPELGMEERSEHKTLSFVSLSQSDDIPVLEEVYPIITEEDVPSIDLDSQGKVIRIDDGESESADDSLEIPILTENSPIADHSSEENPPVLEPYVTTFPSDYYEEIEMILDNDNGLSEVEIVIPSSGKDDCPVPNFTDLAENFPPSQFEFNCNLGNSFNTFEQYDMSDNHLNLKSQTINRFEQVIESKTIVPKTSSPKKVNTIETNKHITNYRAFSKSRNQIARKMILKKYSKVMCEKEQLNASNVSNESLCTETHCAKVDNNCETDRFCVNKADNETKSTSTSVFQVDSYHNSLCMTEFKDLDLSTSRNNQQLCGNNNSLNYVKRKEQIAHQSVQYTAVRTENSGSACIKDSSFREIHHVKYKTSHGHVSRSETRNEVKLFAKKQLAIEPKSHVGEDILHMSFGFTFHYKGITVNRNDSYTQVILKLTKGQNIFLSVEALTELKETLTSAGNDPNCQVLIVNGIGNTFCSGLDLKPLLGPKKNQVSKEMAVAVKEFIEALAVFYKPLVAVVNGAAVGLGVTLLTYSDVVLASDNATFHMPYTQLGYMPEGAVTLTLPQVVGSTVAMDLLLRGRKITAEEACDHGLVSQVLEAKMLPYQLVSRVRMLAENPVSSMETTKAMLRMHLLQKLNLTLENEIEMLPKQWLSQSCQLALKDAFQNGLFEV